jgi:hypothetical protein
MDAETTRRGGPEPVLVRRSGQGWQVGLEETEIAEAVVDSTSNPLLPLPEELARKQIAPRRRGRSPRRVPRGVRGDGSPRADTEENVGGSR